MKKLTTSLAFLFTVIMAWSQTARVQIIHNSPTPTVDIYAGTAKLLDNFAFRTATPYIDVPANTPINIGVALANSTSSSDAIATFPVTFQANRTYIVVAAGVVGGAQPFNLFAYDMGAETSNTPGNVGIAFFHGSPDAPEVDITTGGNVLYDNVSFGEFSGYLNVPAASYQLDVTPGNNNSTIVASYNADFSFWKGRTAVVFASGFLGGGSPGFEPWVALDNGGTFPLKSVTTGGGGGTGGGSTALVQIIHNSPTPTVDLWVNGSKFLDDFAFRTATPYVDVPAGVNLNLGVALGNSMMASEALVSYNLNLTAGKKYVVVANGIVGGNPGFDLEIYDMGQEMADAPGNVGILFFHGSPDAPEVDITTGGNVLYDNVSFGEFSGYLNVPAASYQLDVTPGNNNSTIVASYDADLSFWKGRTCVVFASGFLGGGSPGFEPWVALDNGGTFPLRLADNFTGGGGSTNRAAVTAVTTKATVYPNPASSLLNVNLETSDEAEVVLSVVNVNGQTVLVQNIGIQSAGVQTAQLDLNGLQNGTYFLRTQTGKEVSTTRFQVIR
ncbi:MAG: DUF4397 domain-containing protein [Saprospiraceae bacterium]|nr:DUF4397 domain-containing protein [Saprospiraceae bacterium]